MVDFSDRETLKQHKNSINSMSKSIIEKITSLTDEFNNLISSCDIDRKEQAEAIEESIKIIHDNNIKLPKPLNQYQKSDIPDILIELALRLKNKPEVRKILEKNAKIVESRLTLINKKTPKILELEKSLSEYHVKEQDYDDEVVIDLKKTKEPSIQLRGLENFNVQPNELNEEPKEENIPEQVVELPSKVEEIPIQEDDELANEEYDIVQEHDKAYEVLIKSDATLMQFCGEVYGDSSYWGNILHYGNNATVVGGICQLNGFSENRFAVTPGLLKGVILEFPKELRVYERETGGQGRKKFR